MLNYEDEILREFGKNIVPKAVYFSSARELEQGIFLRGKEIVLRAGEKEFVITTTDRLKILGRHNHENTMAAAAWHIMQVFRWKISKKVWKTL